MAWVQGSSCAGRAAATRARRRVPTESPDQRRNQDATGEANDSKRRAHGRCDAVCTYCVSICTCSTGVEGRMP